MSTYQEDNSVLTSSPNDIRQEGWKLVWEASINDLSIDEKVDRLKGDGYRLVANKTNGFIWIERI